MDFKAVLVAISIPIFTAQLEKSRDATTVSNLRAAYAEAAVEVLEGSTTSVTRDVTAMGTQDGLTGGEDLPFTLTDTSDKLGKGTAKRTVNVTFDFSDPDAVKCTVN